MPVIFIADAEVHDPEACIAIDAGNESGYTRVRIDAIRMAGCRLGSGRDTGWRRGRWGANNAPSKADNMPSVETSV